MCQFDVDMGRKSGVYTKVVNVGTSATELTGESPMRMTLIVSCPASTRITISQDPNVTDANGIILNNGGGPLVLDIQRHGSIVTRRLFAVSQTSAQNVGVTEVIAAS